MALNTAFTRSPLTGWTIAAGTPVEALTAPLWRELAITASIGGILLVVGLLFAIGMATRIARGEMLHDLLINELNHRVKNTLATVQSIASQTLRRTDNPAEAIDKFSARLVSLGRTHNVLSEEKWESAQVRELVDGALAPYAGGTARAFTPPARISGWRRAARSRSPWRCMSLRPTRRNTARCRTTAARSMSIGRLPMPPASSG